MLLIILTLLSIGGTQVTIAHSEFATLALELDSTIGSQNLLAILVKIAIAANDKFGGGRGCCKSESNGGEDGLHID